MFCNKFLLCNIRKAEYSLTIHSTGGTSTTSLIGDFPGYGTEWFDPTGIANIMSLMRGKEHFRIIYDSDNGNTFYMYLDDGDIRKFH